MSRIRSDQVRSCFVILFHACSLNAAFLSTVFSGGWRMNMQSNQRMFDVNIPGYRLVLIRRLPYRPYSSWASLRLQTQHWLLPGWDANSSIVTKPRRRRKVLVIKSKRAAEYFPWTDGASPDSRHNSFYFCDLRRILDHQDSGDRCSQRRYLLCMLMSLPMGGYP